MWKYRSQHLSTMLYQVNKWEMTAQKHLQTHCVKTIINRFTVTVDTEKQFSVKSMTVPLPQTYLIPLTLVLLRETIISVWTEEIEF